MFAIVVCGGYGGYRGSSYSGSYMQSSAQIYTPSIISVVFEVVAPVESVDAFVITPHAVVRTRLCHEGIIDCTRVGAVSSVSIAVQPHTRIVVLNSDSESIFEYTRL